MDSVCLTADGKEAKIVILEQNIKQYIEEDNTCKEALIILKNCLRGYSKNSNATPINIYRYGLVSSLSRLI